jgi:hypothetical protein
MEEAERSLKRGMSTLSARDRCGSEDMCVPRAIGVGGVLYHLVHLTTRVSCRALDIPSTVQLIAFDHGFTVECQV